MFIRDLFNGQPFSGKNFSNINRVKNATLKCLAPAIGNFY